MRIENNIHFGLFKVNITNNAAENNDLIKIIYNLLGYISNFSLNGNIAGNFIKKKVLLNKINRIKCS